MSTIKVDTVKNRSSAINLPNNFKIGGLSIIQGYTSSGSEPGSPSTGDFWWDSTNEKLYRYIDGGFKELTISATASFYGDRAHKAGVSHSNTNRIEYWSMASAGNAADFGNLTTGGYARQGMASDSTRIYMPLFRDTTQIDYWASATLGNASDYGDLRYGPFDGDMESNGSVALHVYGYARNGGVNYIDGLGNKIDQFTVGTGNAGVTATNFGDQLLGSNQLFACVSNGTRMLIAGGNETGGDTTQETIGYVTFATAGNASDAGDLAVGRNSCAGSGSGAGDIACFGGGGISGGYTNSIDQKNVSNTSNATDFGDLSGAAYYNAGCYNATKGHFIGGYDTTAGGASNVIQQVTFATAANATDFGDLLEAGFHCRASSGAAS